ncbi:MAG: sensor histidine kinase [Microthrixaceae bacterium]|nr:sensor histidine kinase [Microthrixaceae bacterium]
MLARLKVRTKLLTILLPLLMGIGVLAGLGVMDRLDQRGEAQRTQILVETAHASASVVHELQLERLLSVALQGGETSVAQALEQQKPATDRAASILSTRARDLAEVDGSVGNQRALQAATEVDQLIDAIDGARRIYKPNGGSATAVSDAYSSIIAGLDQGATRLMATAGGTDGGRSIHWLSAAKEADARSAADVAIVAAATRAGALADVASTVEEIRDLRGDSLTATTVFTTDTDQLGRTRFDAVLRDPGFADSQQLYSMLGTLDSARGIEVDLDGWIATSEGRLEALRKAESALFGREVKAAQTTSDALEREVRLYLGGTATVFLLALLLAASVTRSITSALGRLTSAARTISTEQLPKLVESLRRPEVDQELTLTDIDLNSQDEFAELAAAFNAGEQTALDVAAEQVATLRKGISDIFVNLARRNQSLLDRQIEFIDRLEANEEDPDQLENLFKLDHLATRMRRNAESLLVLAGAEAPRRRTREVSFTDVIRVAVGEVEDFARITLLAVDEASAVGAAAVDIAHLLSELMENGTQFSPPDKRVEIVGHRTNDGGYVVSITDQGVGMPPEALAEANRQLARPPVVGLSLSRSLGFVVVATLAHRHGIEVRLTDSPAGGVTALVALPPSLLVHPQLAPQPIAEGGGEAAVADLPSFDIAAMGELGVPGEDPAPAFQLEPGLDWAPDPPSFVEPAGEPVSEGIVTQVAEPEPSLPEVGSPIFDDQPLGVPGVLDPSFGLAAPPLAAPPEPAELSVPRSAVAEASPEAVAETGPATAERMNSAFEQGLFALLNQPSSTEPSGPPAPVPPPVPEVAFPPAPPGPSTPPALPQRARREPVTTPAPSDERIGSPSRPPEEIRNILSRYRSGLHSGRAESAASDPQGATSPDADPPANQFGGSQA